MYRASTPPPSLEELNSMLESQGEGTIRLRTYRHYRRMAFNGFDKYLPINEVDVKLKLRRARRRPGGSTPPPGG
jgi:hypothetical protein